MLNTLDAEALVGAAMRVIQEGTGPDAPATANGTEVPAATAAEILNPTASLMAEIDAAIEDRNHGAILKLAPRIALLSVLDLAIVTDKLREKLGRAFPLREFNRAIKEAKRDHAKRERGPFPEIRISNRPLRDISTQALVALRRYNDPPSLFVRAGRMVFISRDERDRPAIEQSGEAYVRGRLDRSANYIRAGMGGDVSTPPPLEVVKDVLSLPSEQWALPPLTCIVEAPTLRPDGTVLYKPGYDADSHMFYAPAPGLEVMPVCDSPDREDVEAAVTFLEEAVGEFPYADPASRANMFGLLLTPIVRTAFAGCTPIALVDSPKAGTGKSLLVDTISTITTGRAAAMTPFPRTEEEMGKQILASLISGRPLICFDNLEGVLQSPALALALTAKEYEARVLGASENISLPNNATWVVTGNNIRPSGDMPRRCYHIRLDAKMSNPFRGRTFKHPNLLDWTRENRGKLIHALLTMARSWWAAGCPQRVKDPLGSFESWHRTVGSILGHCGIDGFLGNIEQFLDEADEVARQWEGFLLTLADHFGGRSFTSNDLAERIKHSDELQKILPDNLAEAFERKPATLQRFIGKAFTSRRDLRFGDLGVFIKRGSEDTKTRAFNWRIIVPNLDGKSDNSTDDDLI